MNDFDQDNQFRDEFLWLEREKGRSPKETKADKESKVERDLRQRVEFLERELMNRTADSAPKTDSQDEKFQGDSEASKKASEARLDAVNEECRIQQAEGYRTSFGEGIL